MSQRSTAIALFLLGVLIMLVTIAPRIGSALSTGLIGGVPLAYQQLDHGTSIRNYDSDARIAFDLCDC